MGEVLWKLAEAKLDSRDKHNKRLFVDLSESIHIHYREHRLVFGVNEFRHFSDVVIEALQRLEEEVSKGYRSKSDGECRENIKVKTQIIAGSQKKSIPIPNPIRSKYFDDRLVIERQTDRVRDKFHVHYRDLRIVFNNDKNFLNVCDTFARAAHVYHSKIEVAEIKPRWDRKTVNDLNHVDHGVPIIVDKFGVIVDGHHRYYFALEQGIEKIDSIQLRISFDESKPIRAFDLYLKKTQQWELLKKYKRLLALLAGLRF